MAGDVARPMPPRVPTVRREAVGPETAAQLMDVSESTIRRLIRAGKLPAIRVGKQWRILISDLRRGSQR